MNENIESGTRAKIISEALRLFATKGYPNTSMDDIAREVGISKPAIYHYFGSKEALFRALIEAAKTEQAGMVEQLRQRNLPLPELIEESIRLMSNAILKTNPYWLRVMLQINSYPTELADLVDFVALHQEAHQMVVDLFRSSAADISFRPGVTLDGFAFFFHSVTFSYIGHCLFAGQKVDDENDPKKLADFIMYGAFGKQ